MFQDPTSTLIDGGAGVVGWRTNPTVPLVTAPDATLSLIVAPTSGGVGVASADYVVAVDGDSDGDVVMTPSIASSVPPGATGTFTPSTATVNTSSALYDTFTFTPDDVAEYTLALTNNRGLGNPAPFAYSSQSTAPPPLDLSESWIVDLHPGRPFEASQGVVPAGVADYAGDSNAFNIHSQYATDAAIVVYPMENAHADLDADSLTRNAYETIQIITDPDNPARQCYVLRVDKTASGWNTGANKKKVRAQIGITGTARLTRPWGLDTWVVVGIRIPAVMKTIPPQQGNFDWTLAYGYHTTGATDAGGTYALEWRGGGPGRPQDAQLFIRWNHATTPTAQYTWGDLLLLGGDYGEVPADTWIYVIVNHRLWHGYPDPSPSPVTTPTGDFYIRPYVAVGDGPAVPRATHEGLWGIPYPAGSVGWARPHYPQITMYTNPSDFAGDLRQFMHLGLMEFLASDNPDPVNYPTLNAQHILDAFKASRLITP